MAATRNTPPESGDTQTSRFSEEERSELSQLIADAVKGGSAPVVDEGPKGPKKLSDSEWDDMTDRAREKWVRELVDFRLDELAKNDDDRQLREKVDALADRKPEPEAVPSTWSKVQRLIWGDRDQ
jgi:hypothetical protein